MNEEKFRADIVVTGKVQGVWYRAYTRKQAIAAGVTGWVMNKKDGSVVASLEGTKKVLEDMVKKLKKGPPFSSVEDISIVWSNCPECSQSFDIRKTE